MSSLLHILSCSAGWISDAKKLTQRLRDISTCGQSLLSQADLRRLLSVQRRVDALLQPLQLCVLRAPATPTAQRTVASVMDLVRKVGGIIEHADWQPAADRGHILRELDPYVRELDFAALAIAMVLSATPAQSVDDARVSPSRLLDASVRLDSPASVHLHGLWFRSTVPDGAWTLVGDGQLTVQVQPARYPTSPRPNLNGKIGPKSKTRCSSAPGQLGQLAGPQILVECGAETAAFPLKLLSRAAAADLNLPPPDPRDLQHRDLLSWDAVLWSDTRSSGETGALWTLLEPGSPGGGHPSSPGGNPDELQCVPEQRWQYAFASPDVEDVWYAVRLAVYQDVTRADGLRNAQVPSDEVLRALLQR